MSALKRHFVIIGVFGNIFLLYIIHSSFLRVFTTYRDTFHLSHDCLTSSSLIDIHFVQLYFEKDNFFKFYGCNFKNWIRKYTDYNITKKAYCLEHEFETAEKMQKTLRFKEV